MNKEIDLGGLKVPQSDWEATPERIQQVMLNLLEQLKLQNDRITERERFAHFSHIAFSFTNTHYQWGNKDFLYATDGFF